jgi:hypothetical protein
MQTSSCFTKQKGHSMPPPYSMGDGTICEDWIRIYGMGWKAWVKFDPQRANCRFDMIDHVTI